MRARLGIFKTRVEDKGPLNSDWAQLLRGSASIRAFREQLSADQLGETAPVLGNSTIYEGSSRVERVLW